MDAPTIGFVAVVFVLAGLVKGTIGLGLPTVAVGLLGLVMPPSQAAALLLAPSLMTNAWQVAAGPGLRPLLRRLWPLLGGVLLGAWLASGALSGGAAAARAMGAALLCYGLLGLLRIEFRVPRAAERWASLPVGLLSGAITAATGTFVLPGVPYIQALGLERDALVQALGLLFTVSTLGLALSLAGHGTVRAGALGVSLLALAPAMLGMWLGGRLRSRVRPQTFRSCFFLGLAGLGGHLLVG